MDFTQPVTLTFIFQTIGVILAITALGILGVKIKSKKIGQKKCLKDLEEQE
jgi:ABC-type dipeptide/oligopeptide/nickel transport system permease subunit